MKKIFSVLLVLILTNLLFTSCLQFLEPGYWQELGDRIASREVVKSMPNYLNKYKWSEVTSEEADKLWQTDAYRENIKNPPKNVTIYQPGALKSYYKSKDCKVEKFPNYIYSKEIAEYIYVIGFESDCYGEDSIALNRYIPSAVPAGTKLYKARDDEAFVKMVIPSENEDDESLRKPQKTLIFKNGLVIQQEMSTSTVAEY